MGGKDESVAATRACRKGCDYLERREGNRVSTDKCVPKQSLGIRVERQRRLIIPRLWQRPGGPFAGQIISAEGAPHSACASYVHYECFGSGSLCLTSDIPTNATLRTR